MTKALRPLLIAAFALALTFAQPSLRLERDQFSYVIVLDITQSMNTLDYRLEGKPVSRLAFAKRALHDMLIEMPCGSKVGWGIFTEYRTYLLIAPVEVCASYSELALLLDRIDGRMAWAGASEVAKAVNWGMRIVKSLPERPNLIFVTDGHEAPPINPLHLPAIEVNPGEVRGMLIGTGGLIPLAIPKFDPDGNPLGYWRADEVLQTDIYTRGRGASEVGEQLAETEAAPKDFPVSAGNEHLSSLRESYLQQLAARAGLGYHRLESAAGLAAALKSSTFARPARILTDLRWLFALVALAALTAGYVWREQIPRLPRPL